VRAVVASTGASGLPEVAGNTWAFLQYVVGLDRLGVETFWVDHQARLDPRKAARDRRAQPHEDCHSIDYVEARFQRTARDFGFDGRWCIVYDEGASHLGLSADDLGALVGEADVLFNLGGPLPAESPLLRIPCRVYVDLDPGFTQIWAHQIDMGFRAYDFFFTVGQRVGGDDFPIPTL
jgi:hypothetical protein